MKIPYANELIINMGLGYPKTCVYQLIFHNSSKIAFVTTPTTL